MPLSAKPQGAGAGMSLELAISPAGRMHLEHLPGNPDLDPAAQARIERAYAQGDGPGLLHLGAVELTTWLPPSLAFGRELAQGYMARLCAVPDLAARWDGVEVATPAAEVERLLAEDGAPPAATPEIAGDDAGVPETVQNDMQEDR